MLDMRAERLQLFDKLFVAAAETSVVPSAIKPATTRAAPPRRSGEVTCAPEKPLTP